MRILWIKAGPFHPLDNGGRIRSWNILQELGKLDEVTAFCYLPAYLAQSPDGIKHSLAELIQLSYPAPRKYSLSYALNYLRRLPSPVPYSVRKNFTFEVQGRVRALLETKRFDVVVCDFLSSCLNMPNRSPRPNVLFAHNVETMIWQRHFQVEHRPLRKPIIGLEYWKMRRFEPRQAARFQHLMAVSEVDGEHFARFLPRDRISVLPTGVDLSYFRPADAVEIPGRLVFTGTMDWLPNEDAVLWFASQILPKVARQCSEVSLKVVGREPTRQLGHVAEQNPRVEVTGSVPDIRPCIAEAAVYVVPLRVGGGTRLKIFEAMAMGKAVVSTHVGAEGLPVEHGRHLLLADEPVEFSAAVVRLLEDTALRRRLGQAARQLVESRYGWPSVAKTCHGILQHVVELASGPASAI